MSDKKWYCCGEDIESTQELSGPPGDYGINPDHCAFAKNAKEAYRKYKKKWKIKSDYWKDKK